MNINEVKERWKVKKSELLALPEHEYDAGSHNAENPYQMKVSYHIIKGRDTGIVKATLFDRDGVAQAIIFCQVGRGRDITYLPQEARWSEACLENLTIKDNEWYNKRYSIAKLIYYASHQDEIEAAKYFGYESIPSADAILAFQYENRNRKLQQQHERTRQFIESLMCQLKPIPTDIEDYARKQVFVSHRYIFYKRRGNQIEGVCSYCHSTVSLAADGHKHNDEVRCPHCHKKVTLKAEGRIQDLTQNTYFVIINKISTGLMLRRFYAHSRISHVENISTQQMFVIFEDARAFIPFNGTKAKHYVMECKDGKEVWKYVEERDHYWYSGGTTTVPAFWFPLYQKGLTQELRGTPFEYSGLKEAAKGMTRINGREIDPETYLFRWKMEPMLEALVKAKLFTLAWDVCYGSWRISSVSLSSSKFATKQDRRLHKLLNVRKSDIKVIRTYDFNHDQLNIYRLVMGESDAIEWVKLAKMKSDTSDSKKPAAAYLYPKLKECIGKFGIKVARRVVFEYLPKQRRENTDSIEDLLYDWLDYTDECRELQYNMEDTMVLYPKNMLHSHSITSRKIEKQKTMVVDKQIRHRYKSDRRQYEYRSGDYMVMLPRNQTDLINEGKRLCHCVGRYDERVASGSTTILFIRRRNEPSVPFVTAEFSQGRVVQIRAYKNGTPDKDTLSFFEDYKAKVLSNFMRKAGKTA